MGPNIWRRVRLLLSLCGTEQVPLDLNILHDSVTDPAVSAADAKQVTIVGNTGAGIASDRLEPDQTGVLQHQVPGAESGNSYLTCVHKDCGELRTIARLAALGQQQGSQDLFQQQYQATVPGNR